MEIFKSLIITIAICSSIRGMLSILSPEGHLKKFTEITANVIIMSAILTEILIIIRNIFS